MDTQHRVEGTRTGPFTPADRLLASSEFRHVLRHGRRVAQREFLVLTAPTLSQGDAGARRLGITVSRRVGGAVVRNRLKRRIRAWFRTGRENLVRGSDVVVIVRRPALDLSARAFVAALNRGLGEAGP